MTLPEHGTADRWVDARTDGSGGGGGSGPVAIQDGVNPTLLAEVDAQGRLHVYVDGLTVIADTINLDTSDIEAILDAIRDRLPALLDPDGGLKVHLENGVVVSGTVNIGTMPEVEIKNDSGNPIPTSPPAAFILSQTISALGGISSINLGSNASGASVLGLHVDGTWVGTLVFEGTLDNSTWFPISANTPTGSVQGTSNNGLFLFAAMYRSIRVRATAWTSGSASIFYRAGYNSTVTAPLNTDFSVSNFPFGERVNASSLPVTFSIEQNPVLSVPVVGSHSSADGPQVLFDPSPGARCRVRRVWIKGEANIPSGSSVEFELKLGSTVIARDDVIKSQPYADGVVKIGATDAVLTLELFSSQKVFYNIAVEEIA